jgi:hypothetical protein
MVMGWTSSKTSKDEIHGFEVMSASSKVVAGELPLAASTVVRASALWGK